MLKKSLIPTRLVESASRIDIPIVEAKPPSKFRGIYVTARFLHWGAGILRLKLARKLTRQEYAIRFKRLLEDLGGLWIKLGQLISLRVDLFSAELCNELGKLVDQATGFPPEHAIRIVEEDLGGPIDVFFEQFERLPFAAASIGQVHRALLREEQVWVAVKVMRPHIAQLYLHELKFMERIARFLQKRRILPVMRWEVLIWELNQIMTEEIDYRFEAGSMRRMRRSLRKHNIYVPKVFMRYSTRRILVSEFVHAVLMSDYIKVATEDPARLAAWCQENNVKPKLLARRLIFSLMRQVFEDNLYHGDLHPGNIILLRNSRSALIDFGAVCFTEMEYLQKFRFFMVALSKKDFARAADMIFLLSASLPPIELDFVKERMIRALRTWATRAQVRDIPYHDKSIANVTVEVTKILFEENCTAEWAFLRLRRALTTLDASLIYLYPTADYTKITKRYFTMADRRNLDAFDPGKIVTRGITGLGKMMEILDRFDENSLFYSSIIRRHATIFEGATSKLSDFLSRAFGDLARLMYLVALAALIVFLHQRQPAYLPEIVRTTLAPMLEILPRLGNLSWLLAVILNVYAVVVFTRLRKRFAQKEARIPDSRVAL